MNLAISNIAWDATADDAMATEMRAAGAGAVEIAPTKYWKDLAWVSVEETAGVRSAWERRGVPIISTQALLFGKPDLALFDGEPQREKTLAYLEKVLDLGAQLGARVQVFGSPKNRRVGDGDRARAWTIAVESFRRLGEYARSRNTRLCIEPNPPAYGCDFITRADEGADLVDAVGSEGFGLHLDAAGMVIAGDDPVASILKHANRLRHFHLSAPDLGPVGPDAGIPYSRLILALRDSGFGGWLTIEMRQQEGDGVAAAARALRFISSLGR